MKNDYIRLPGMDQVNQREARIERSKFVYELINRWIDNADNKVSISCGIFTGVFGVITFLSERYNMVSSLIDVNNCWMVAYIGSFAASIIAMTIAILFYALAIIPNLNSNNKNNKTKKYPVFYGDISSIERDEYINLMENSSSKLFNDELDLECWHNARVCMRKMSRYRVGIISSLVAVILAFLSFGIRIAIFKCS